MNDLNLGEIIHITVYQDIIENNEDTQFYYLSFNTLYLNGTQLWSSSIQYGFFHDSTP